MEFLDINNVASALEKGKGEVGVDSKCSITV